MTYRNFPALCPALPPSLGWVVRLPVGPSWCSLRRRGYRHLPIEASAVAKQSLRAVQSRPAAQELPMKKAWLQRRATESSRLLATEKLGHHVGLVESRKELRTETGLLAQRKPRRER